MKSLKLLLLLAGCFYLSPTSAQNTKIESYFNAIDKVHQINGNILLAQNNKVVASRAFGYADIVTHKPNTTATRFNLASISKLFTSTAILQLRDKGKLSLDDHLTKFFPGFPFADITIRHLLTHTSGLPDFALYDQIAQKKPGKVIINADLLQGLAEWKGGLSFKPGDDYRYCNVGYNLLALVIEKVSRLSLSDYLQQYIFKPAGMNDAYLSIYGGRYFYNDARCAKMHYQPHPYYDTTYVHADSTAQVEYMKFSNYIANGLVGGSNIITTTTDLQKFDEAFFSGKLVKAATMNEALAPMKLNNGTFYHTERMDTMPGDGTECIGLGWELFDQPGYGRSAGHGGFLYGNATFYIHNLAKNQTVITFDNTACSEYGLITGSVYYLLNGNPPLEIRTHHSMAFVYGSILVKQGVDAAATAFNTIKSDTAHYYLSEWEFNQLGGNLMFRSLFEGHQALSLEVFKINTILFPDSFNTYDSYAQGLQEVGRKKEAILMFQKSIVLNPNNEDGKQALRELLSK